MALTSPTTAEIPYSHTVNSRLKYLIYSSGLIATINNTRDELSLTVLNSRKTETPGYINIPIEELDTLIQDLAQLKANLEQHEDIHTT